MGAIDRAREILMTASESAVDGQAGYLLTVETLLVNLLGADLVVWNGIDAQTAEVMVAGSASDEWRWLLPVLADTLSENPLALSFLSYDGIAPPTRMSDLVGRRTLTGGRLYAELWRPMGAEYQVGIPTYAPSRGVSRGWAVNRSRSDFTSQQMEVLTVLQPALVALEDVIENRAPAAHAIDSRVGLADLVRQNPSRAEALTQREVQVLDLIAMGWTARHVAHQLRISPRTVRKHLEHIYNKLGARDRLTAVLAAKGVEG